MKHTLANCRIIKLNKIHNRAGNITPVEGNKDIPFKIERVYYLYDVPGGESRGGHAHLGLEQLIVAASGSFEIILDDGKEKQTVMLNRPDFGLYVTPYIWREIVNFSSGAVLLVLASMKYTEEDYIRSYENFIKIKNEL